MLRACSVIASVWLCSSLLTGAYASQPASAIEFERPYFAAGFDLATTAAGYARLHNLTNTHVHITHISVPEHIAKGASLHRSVSADNMVKMQKLADGLTLKPDAQLTFETGGYHVMLHNLTRPLEVGTKVPVTFHFRAQRSQQVNFSVHQLDNGGHQHHHE
ncbi:copper chaperone PCu(A)C [Salinimonas marina]|uniref:Copper chaperone PCu(A)C n=1 Tax=Salinimonas marina TaxID=2785918 RepID=A0A7S9DWW8_9ALTE|nr:copper chaperone PCu(A)C [Salinimonas marina]QPG05370.1 copper chaperone PCu(A)C [Salinimonas marina]